MLKPTLYVAANSPCNKSCLCVDTSCEVMLNVLHLAVTSDPPQAAVILEKAQVGETTGEVTQDGGSQYCESVGLPIISPIFALPNLSVAYCTLHSSDETGSYVYVYLNRVATSGTVLQ